MRLFPDFSTFLEIGPLSIKWYAVLIMTGAFLAFFLSAQSFKKTAHRYELISDLFLGVMIAGVIGARLWYVLFYNFSWYLEDPLRILMTREGGLAIQGGLIFGIVYAIWFSWRHRINFFRLADMVLPNVLLAQAMGRWGNFMNHEAFGRVVGESYFQGWPAFIKDNMFIGGAYREPTFLYESVACILGWLLITFVIKKFIKYKRGDLAYSYLIWYGAIRFVIEGFRSDSLMFMGIRTAQVVSIIFIVIGILGWLGLFRKIFPNKPVVLFDFDGTLADTEELILETFRRIFKKHKPDYELTKAEELALIGPALKTSFPHYFPEAEIPGLIDEFVTLNKELHEEYIKPMNNAEELLKYLRDSKYKTGIVSSKFHDSVALGIEILGFTSYFDVVIGLDDVVEHKPHPEGILKACDILKVSYDDVVYVGDSAADIEAGRNAHCFTIGYLFNEDRKQLLRDSGPNVVIEDLLEVEAILKGEQGWTDDLT